MQDVKDCEEYEPFFNHAFKDRSKQSSQIYRNSLLKKFYDDLKGRLYPKLRRTAYEVYSVVNCIFHHNDILLSNSQGNSPLSLRKNSYGSLFEGLKTSNIIETRHHKRCFRSHEMTKCQSLLIYQKQTRKTIKGLLLKLLMTCHLGLLVWSTIAFVRSCIKFYRPVGETKQFDKYCSEDGGQPAGLLVITLLTCLLGIGLYPFSTSDFT